MKKILLIADYFGPAPSWLSLFFASCGANPSIDWLLNTDCPRPEHLPSNVTFRSMSFDDYCARVSKRLDIAYRPQAMQNIANLRPAYGVLYEREIDGYDHFGWCDWDIVWGNIRQFLSEDLLKHGVVTTSGSICAGHLTILKSERKYQEMFNDIPDWHIRMTQAARTPWPESLDEAWLSRLCSPAPRFRMEGREAGLADECLDKYRTNNFFEEQWTTPFTPGPWLDGEPLHPEVWYWSQGSLTNWRDGERSFPYLHLMNFKAMRYVDRELYGLQRTWDGSMRRGGPSLLEAEVVRIDRTGLTPMGVAQAEDDKERLRRYRKMAGEIQFADASDLSRWMRPFGSLGAHMTSGGLSDPAGVVPVGLRRALWRAALPQQGVHTKS
jgi:hypothetical protein